MKKTTTTNQSNPRIYIDDGISKKYRVLHKIDVNDYGDLLLTLESGERLQFTPFGKVETIPAPAEIRLISPFRHSKTRELDGTFGLTFHDRKTARGLLEILPPERGKEQRKKDTVVVSSGCKEVITETGKVYECDARTQSFLKYFKKHKTNKDNLTILEIAEQVGYPGRRNDSPSRVMLRIHKHILERDNDSEVSGIYRVKKNVVFE